MNVLPDYLIQYMPELEEALEELRLSVIDHAYELIKCLDVDELTTDVIRQKLELYDVKVDNVANEWLPNGRFYRLYPYIRQHRSRQNTITAIAKSGGQFEGLWSDDFKNKSTYNFNEIAVARHYEIAADADGYFFVSGDIVKDKRGRVISSAAHALSTDILINQSLPAGYTYLYMPYPRPVYPADSGCFYTIHMLEHDRLQYTQDCYSLPEDIKDVPASTNYNWSTGENTPWRAPYWFDYHYMDDMTHSDSNATYAGTWPITERGIYKDENGITISELPPKDAISYELDPSCDKLGDSDAVFPTKCYVVSKNKTSVPNREQKFVPKITDNFAYSIDENDILISPSDDPTKPGPYRHDILNDSMIKFRESMHHFKEYKPFYNEQPIWTSLMQSNTDDELSNHSLYHWINLNQHESRPDISNAELYGDSIIASNKPPVSEVTFTSYHRPVRTKLDPLYVGYLSDDVTYQDENVELDNTNKIYSFDADEDPAVNPLPVKYDPTIYYTITGLGYKDVNGDQIIIKNHLQDNYYDSEDLYATFVGDPCTKDLRIAVHTNSNHHNGGYNYITYKKSNIHKLWFSENHRNALIIDPFTRISSGEMYNMRGDHHIYDYSSNDVVIQYKVIGVFDENDNSLNYTSGSLSCFIEKYGADSYEYHVEYADLKSGDNLIETAAYILFTVKIRNGHLPETQRTDITLNTIFNTATRALSIADLGEFKHHEVQRNKLCGVLTLTDDSYIDGDIKTKIDRNRLSIAPRTLSSNNVPVNGVIEEYTPSSQEGSFSTESFSVTD
jgi:hypothetical protein